MSVEVPTPAASSEASSFTPIPSPSSPTKRASVSASPVPMSVPAQESESAFFRFVQRFFRPAQSKTGENKPVEMRSTQPEEQFTMQANGDNSSDDDHDTDEEQSVSHTPGVSDSLSALLEENFDPVKYAQRYGISPRPSSQQSEIASEKQTGAAGGGGAARSASSPKKRARRHRLDTTEESHRSSKNTDDENTDDEI
ncbi:hypothetical protein EBR77_01080 [bacterium]|nr:hypothetical protein [bacterium]NBX78223.1 hypothetical protein [bacterium]